ncbi:hypothetical protein BX600DRAFT_432445 [Xylariales sp. PMI_506]|nr:hypothetical protein BX600DRAFT_432445 [Xylariales sp. PMI_506]
MSQRRTAGDICRLSTSSEQQANSRYQQDLLSVLSLLPRYNTSPSSVATASAMADVDEDQPSPSATHPHTINSPTLRSPAYGDDQEQLRQDNAIHVKICTRVNVTDDGRRGNSSCSSCTGLEGIPSPTENACHILRQVLGILKQHDVPLNDGERPRPIYIDIDAGTNIGATGDNVQSGTLGEEAGLSVSVERPTV